MLVVYLTEQSNHHSLIVRLLICHPIVIVVIAIHRRFAISSSIIVIRFPSEDHWAHYCVTHYADGGRAIFVNGIEKAPEAADADATVGDWELETGDWRLGTQRGTAPWGIVSLLPRGCGRD